MNVAGLQGLLRSIGEAMIDGGAKAVGDEIRHMADKLTPFNEYTLKKFAEFLEKAEAQARGVPPKGRGTSKPKVVILESEKMDAAVAAVQALYSRALDPGLTEQAIGDEVKRATKGLKKPQLDEVASRVGFEQKFKTIPDVVKAITHWIVDRKGSYERASV